MLSFATSHSFHAFSLRIYALVPASANACALGTQPRRAVHLVLHCVTPVLLAVLPCRCICLLNICSARAGPASSVRQHAFYDPRASFAGHLGSRFTAETTRGLQGGAHLADSHNRRHYGFPLIFLSRIPSQVSLFFSPVLFPEPSLDPPAPLYVSCPLHLPPRLATRLTYFVWADVFYFCFSSGRRQRAQGLCGA